MLFVEIQSIFHLVLSKLAECLRLIDSSILSTKRNSYHPKLHEIWTQGRRGNEPWKLRQNQSFLSEFCAQVTAVSR